MPKKIYAYGMDGFIVPMMKRFAAEGCLPNFERMLKEGTVNQTLPSFPVWTPTNWATLCTGAHTGTHDPESCVLIEPFPSPFYEVSLYLHVGQVFGQNDRLNLAHLNVFVLEFGLSGL